MANKVDKYWQKRFTPLEKKITVHEAKISKILNKAIAEPKRTGAFWNAIRIEIHKEYIEIGKLYSKWSKIEIPKAYKVFLKDNMAKVSRLKSITKIAKQNFSKLANNTASTQIVSALVMDSISDMAGALTMGNLRINRLTRLTQQTLVDEFLIDTAVGEAYEAGNLRIATVLKRKGTVANSLVTQAKNGRWVSIIDKNGVTRTYSARYYAEMVSRVKFHEAQSQSALVVANNYETDLVRVSSHNTTTKICMPFEGKIYSISGKDKRFPMLQETSPYHTNCYAKNTQVLTNRGWLYFYEINIDDLIYSLDPTTKYPEWVGIEKQVEKIEKELINFKSNNINISVTLDHNMLFMTDWNYRHGKNNLYFTPAGALIDKKSGAMFASANWYDNNNNNDNKEFEFMGYYMSEGSVYKQSQNSYQISISQDSNKNYKKYKKMLNCMKAVFPNKNIIQQNERLIVYSEKGKFLKEYGLSYNKKIPDFVMLGNRSEIKIFLDAYLLGDGYISKPRKWIGNFTGSISYFTSSPVMAGQLCELITKIGKRPAMGIQKGKKVKFKNGTYLCRDVYIIRECNSQYHTLQSFKYKKIKYNDVVFCLTLKKNHTMLVKSDDHSGVVWSGNCIHYITPTFVEALKAQDKLKEFSDFSKGKTEVYPTDKNFIPVSKRAGIQQKAVTKTKKTVAYQKASPKKKRVILQENTSEALARAT